MNNVIMGIHHVGLKPAKNDFDQVIAFYTDILGLDLVRSWTKEGCRGAMIAAGNQNFMEIIETDAGCPKEAGAGVEHFAFRVTDTDAMIERVRAAGYEVLVEPKDVILPSKPPYPIRVGFCRGVLGEKIEFFCERQI